MMSAANGMSTDAVDRFAEPFAQLFSMMWLHMSRHAQPAWAGESCISTGVSGRSANQHRTLASLTNMGQLAPVIESMTQTLGPESVKAFMLWIFNTVDTELARRVMGAVGNGQSATGSEKENAQRSSEERKR
ncbi:MAG: hypothetical protein WC328_07790 [Kiritimatiellia bacterium]|jgi:hypothetical protein